MREQIEKAQDKAQLARLESRKLEEDFTRKTGETLTAPQIFALLSLIHGPISTGVLSDENHLDCSPSNLTGLMDRLEAKGLVTRDRCMDDRRRVHVTITETGMRLLQTAGAA